MSARQRARAFVLGPSMVVSLSLSTLATVAGVGWMMRGQYDSIRGELAALRAEQWSPAHESEAWVQFLAANAGSSLKAPDVGAVVTKIDRQNRRIQ